jgi:hypothetical protein
MCLNIFYIFLHVMAFVRNGIKYCLTEIFDLQALVFSYRQLRIMPVHRFIPYALCR